MLAGAGAPDAGGAGAVGAGAVGVGAVGVGAVGVGAVGARGLGTAFLCFGVSGSTSGPFWPDPTTSPARQRGIHRRTIFIRGVSRVPRAGSLTGTSGAGSRSEVALPILETLMKRISGTTLAILTVGACAASTAALADNPVGFYLGAGVGYSTVRSDDPAYGLPGYFNDHQTAWKVIGGIRPLPIVGAEVEYIDFGHPNHDYGANGFGNYGLDSHPRAAALFGVGYLPLPVPF